MNTKESIVRNALKLFLEKGFHNVSISMIAAETGISKPAIYHHFKSKDDLVEGVLDYFTSKMKHWNMEYFKGDTNGRKILQKMFKAIPVYKNVEQVVLDEIKGDYKYSFNELIITLSKYKSEFRERIARDITGGTDKILNSLEDIREKDDSIKTGVDLKKLALLTHSILEGSAFLAEVREDIDLQELSDDLFKIYWKLISK